MAISSMEPRQVSWPGQKMLKRYFEVFAPKLVRAWCLIKISLLKDILDKQMDGQTDTLTHR